MCVALILLLPLLLSLSTISSADNTTNSVMWDYTRKLFLGDATYQFDERIKVELPTFAEDSMQVPLLVDASALGQEVVQIIAWADYNPIQHIFTYYPQPGIVPLVALPFKVQQSTPVRAAVQLASGEWRVGTGFVDAAGGGCTLPSMTRMKDDWLTRLGDISAGRFVRLGFSQEQIERYRFRVMHPMDSGLVANIPSFYLEQIELRDSEDKILIHMWLSPAVSENPLITFDSQLRDGANTLLLRDNDGNEFRQVF
ncbi:MAG: quinoprotein dehydrogenase-associated SoxYZ-like carrier [Marinospirillum sp.]|nr:quinoprotein dehydrogenase-associated SoxYZ-like carrier [Marinospirillum sp.]